MDAKPRRLRSRLRIPQVLKATVQLSLAVLGVYSVAETAPAFPWTSFRAIASEHPTGNRHRCDPDDDRTEIAAFLIFRPAGFYRLWTMLRGPDWVAIHYDGEARPDWVWRGTWSGDDLSIASVVAYDPVAHVSGCDLLFRAQP